MTIDELARQAGTTSRTIRLYQTKGVLPPPRTVGRVGYYGQGHLARLRYIARLQERGFSLAAISALLRAWEQGRTLEEVLGFEDALTAPWTDETPLTISRGRLEELFPELAEDETLVQRALDLGLLAREGERFRVPDPRILRIGAELSACGIPLAAALDDRAHLEADAERIAARFVGLFERYVWEPFVAAGLPAERLAAVTDALRRLRPLASVAVLSALDRAMEKEVASSTAEQARRFEPWLEAWGDEDEAQGSSQR